LWAEATAGKIMRNTTELDQDALYAILLEHRGAVEKAFLEVYRKDPDVDCAAVVLLDLNGAAHIMAGDRGATDELSKKIGALTGELNALFSSEASALFSVEAPPGQERVLVVDNARGLVGRVRLGSTARRDVRRERLRAVARQCVLPPPTSAHNVEVLAMSLSVFMHSLRDNRYPWDDDPRNEMPAEVRRVVDAARTIFSRLHSHVLLGEPNRAGQFTAMTGFLGRWKEAAFARLEISHKLAAALCLTDVDESVEVRAPWGAWSLIVPNGLLDDRVSRIWCRDKNPVAIVDAHGQVFQWSEETVGGRVAAEMLLSLVLGACLVLCDPSRIKKTGQWGASDTVSKIGRRQGPPPEGARYLMAHPVSIDLRAEVQSALCGNGRNGGAPKSQFLVRGHPRNQACGPGLSQRKPIWIEPFWKGPEDARILLRSHKVPS
jgi:hypothetical protein